MVLRSWALLAGIACSEWLPLSFPAGVLFFKKRAEEALQRSGLEYTIIRPGREHFIPLLTPHAKRSQEALCCSCLLQQYTDGSQCPSSSMRFHPAGFTQDSAICPVVKDWLGYRLLHRTSCRGPGERTERWPCGGCRCDGWPQHIRAAAQGTARQHPSASGRQTQCCPYLYLSYNHVARPQSCSDALSQVADICVEALVEDAAKNRVFEVITQEGAPLRPIRDLFDSVAFKT